MDELACLQARLTTALDAVDSTKHTFSAEFLQQYLEILSTSLQESKKISEIEAIAILLLASNRGAQ